MSTIKVDNIRIASESVSRPVTGVAASWINFDGGVAKNPASMTGVRGSFNISSLVSIATGVDETNYTNDFANGNYSATVGSTAGGTVHFSSGIYTASTLRTTTKGSSGSNENASFNTFMAVGDLA